MELLYAGIFDLRLQILAEVVRDADARERALEQVATYTQTEFENRRCQGCHFTFAISADGSAIVCLVSRGYSARLAQQLVEAIGRIGKLAGRPAGRGQLEAIVERYVGDAMLVKSEKLTDLNGHLERLKHAAVSNVEELMDRGEKIDVLVGRTDTLATNTQQFKRSAQLLEKTYRWRDRQGWMCLVVLVLAALSLYFGVFRAGHHK